MNPLITNGEAVNSGPGERMAASAAIAVSVMPGSRGVSAAAAAAASPALTPTWKAAIVPSTSDSLTATAWRGPREVACTIICTPNGIASSGAGAEGLDLARGRPPVRVRGSHRGGGSDRPACFIATVLMYRGPPIVKRRSDYQGSAVR
jgi:hypothetical protein